MTFNISLVSMYSTVYAATQYQFVFECFLAVHMEVYSQSDNLKKKLFFLDESQDSFVTSEHAQDKPLISK